MSDELETETNPVEEPSAVKETQASPPGQWFAVHVLSGQEESVRKHMLSRMKMMEVTEDVHEIVIPSERVSEVKRGKKTEVERKLYPGYIFVNLNLLDAEKQLNEPCWYFVKETPGVIGFADGDHPIPMREKEVEGMLSQMRETEDKVVPKVAFELNDTVRVGDGPFEGQEGQIEEIDEERGRVRVAVSIFGRSTPVDLEYWQVEKV
ncbi:MAG: transcription termination/antitermination protein NusG [Verrucomicrobiota bacterium]